MPLARQHGRLIWDAPGALAGGRGVNFDVTEWRQAEQDLRRAMALLRAVGNCSPDPIYAKDTEGGLLFANPVVSPSSAGPPRR